MRQAALVSSGRHWLRLFAVLTIIGTGMLLEGCLAVFSNRQVSRFPDSPISLKSNWFDAQFAPDGQRIACLLTAPDGGLWLVDVETNDIRLLAQDELGEVQADGTRAPSSTHTNPSWSPTGEHLAYLSYAGLAPGVDFKLWTAGGENFSEKSVLYEGTEALYAYKWSPDGKNIGLVDGGSLILAPLTGDIQVLVENAVSAYPLSANAIAWSPDSKWLAYSTTDMQGNREMWAINVDTKEGVQFASSQNDSIVWIPSWSQNGQRVALLEGYVAERGRSVPLHMLIFDKEGIPIKTIGLPEVEIYLGTSVLWSPTGKQIAATFWHGSARDVWTIDVQSSSLLQVTDNGNVSDIIRWSDDGKRLLVCTESAIEPVYASR